MSINPPPFHLDGIVLGFLGQDPAAPTALALSVDQEPLAVQLPPVLCPHIRHYVRAGDRVRCVGHTRVDFTTKLIELSAYQVFSLAAGPEPSAGRSLLSAVAARQAVGVG